MTVFSTGFINVSQFICHINDDQLFKNDSAVLCWSLITLRYFTGRLLTAFLRSCV